MIVLYPIFYYPLDCFPVGAISSKSTSTIGTREVRGAAVYSSKDSDYYIFHNNYVRGRFGKQLRFKEMKLYGLDVNGEYSAVRKYMTVERVNTSQGSDRM